MAKKKVSKPGWHYMDIFPKDKRPFGGLQCRHAFELDDLKRCARCAGGDFNCERYEKRGEKHG